LLAIDHHIVTDCCPATWYSSSSWLQISNFVFEYCL